MIFTAALFEFFRNEALNARNLFATTGSKPRFRRNQYGFVLGGPDSAQQDVLLRRLPGNPASNGTVRTSTVPTTLQRQGIFSTPIFDPATTRQTGSGFVRDRFPNDTIPLDRVRSGRPSRGGPLSASQRVRQWAGGDGQ